LREEKEEFCELDFEMSRARTVLVLKKGEKRNAIMENKEFCGEYSGEISLHFGGVIFSSKLIYNMCFG